VKPINKALTFFWLDRIAGFLIWLTREIPPAAIPYSPVKCKRDCWFAKDAGHLVAEDCSDCANYLGNSTNPYQENAVGKGYGGGSKPPISPVVKKEVFLES
jgi:hypothetical protein